MHGALLIDLLASKKEVDCESFSISDAQQVQADVSKISFEWRGQRIEVATGGHFNVMNALAAATAAAKLGVAISDIAKGLAAAGAISGRFESVIEGQEFGVVIDYAHTPEALQNVLISARQLVDDNAKVIVVFGCGGDRDHSKRPKMGAVAAKLADVIYITSDNPRHEDAQTIANEIMDGAMNSANASGKVMVDLNRRNAIASAFARAKAGDIVVIAGKGHESTQTIGADDFDFNDALVSRELLMATS